MLLKFWILFFAVLQGHFGSVLWDILPDAASQQPTKNFKYSYLPSFSSFESSPMHRNEKNEDLGFLN